MEHRSIPAADIDAARAAIQAQARRVRSFLAAQRQRVARIDRDLAETIARQQQAIDERLAELASRRRQVDDAELELSDRQQSAARLAIEQDSESQRLAELAKTVARQADDLENARQRLRSRRQRLAAELRQARAARQQASHEPPSTETGCADLPQHEELSRQLEKAINDLRQANARNIELEKRLAVPVTPGVVSGRLDWEAEKRRLLAAWEAEDNAATPAARLEVADIIRQTDALVAEKDRELEELRRVLADQSSSLQGIAVGAAALGHIVDQDALVQEERANLHALKQQYEELRRQAEIDLSIERAKLARQRQELEDKLRASEAHLNKTGAAPAEARPVRNRWLSRLGLGESEDEAT